MSGGLQDSAQLTSTFALVVACFWQVLALSLQDNLQPPKMGVWLHASAQPPEAACSGLPAANLRTEHADCCRNAQANSHADYSAERTGSSQHTHTWECPSWQQPPWRSWTLWPPLGPPQGMLCWSEHLPGPPPCLPWELCRPRGILRQCWRSPWGSVTPRPAQSLPWTGLSLWGCWSCLPCPAAAVACLALCPPGSTGRAPVCNSYLGGTADTCEMLQWTAPDAPSAVCADSSL